MIVSFNTPLLVVQNLAVKAQETGNDTHDISSQPWPVAQKVDDLVMSFSGTECNDTPHITSLMDGSAEINSIIYYKLGAAMPRCQ